MEQSTIITDERVIQFTIWLVCLLGTGLVALTIYIFKKVLSEIKSYRADSLLQRQEFNDELKHKFKSINFYMRQTDKLQVRHEQNIDTLIEHARETKYKLIKHEDKINNHGEKLASHDIEIKNLKNKGNG